MKNKLIAFILVLQAFSGFSQYVGFDVFGTQTNPYSDQYSIITLDTLAEAKTLGDMNRWYRASWVDSYIKVEIASTCGDLFKKAISKNDTLTIEQMNLLNRADEDCKIDVQVKYIPKNTLKDNPPRHMNFSLKMIPVHEAKYPGGIQQMKAYLQEKAIDKISKTTFEQIKLATVRFNINEEGQVLDAQIFKTSEDDTIDELMLTAINNMPKWKPAENAEGTKIMQEFDFSLGTLLLYGCYTN